MPIGRNEIKWSIVIAKHKLLPQLTTPDWGPMKKSLIADTFANLSNPSAWPSFFAEAFASTLQQEVMARGSIVPDLLDEVETYARADSTKTWEDLEEYIRDNCRDLTLG